jgi:hypothetical protein
MWPRLQELVSRVSWMVRVYPHYSTNPVAFCISKDDKMIYVCDFINHNIRMICHGQVTTIAGIGTAGFADGSCLSAAFHSPLGICCSDEGRLYVSDFHSHRIRMIYDGKVTTIAGNNGPGYLDDPSLTSSFRNPAGIYCTKEERLYISDFSNNCIRMLYRGHVTTLVGNGNHGFSEESGSFLNLDCPTGICCSTDDRGLYVADQLNHCIREIIPPDHSARNMTLEPLLEFSDLVSDMPLIVKGVLFHLHRGFISLVCPMLMSSETMTLIEKSPVTQQTFQLFVTYLYTNQFCLGRIHTATPYDPTDPSIGLIELIHLCWMIIVCEMPLDVNILRNQYVLPFHKNEALASKDFVDALIELHRLKLLSEENQRAKLDNLLNDHIIDSLKSKDDITTQLTHSMMTNIPADSLCVIMTRLIRDTSVLINP